jgi:hypothetical protein
MHEKEKHKKHLSVGLGNCEAEIASESSGEYLNEYKRASGPHQEKPQ